METCLLLRKINKNNVGISIKHRLQSIASKNGAQRFLWGQLKWTLTFLIEVNVARNSSRNIKMRKEMFIRRRVLMSSIL